MAELTGGVTLLFTDIEGSTALLRELKGSYGLALRLHRSMIEHCFEEQAGREIADEGDGLFFVFPSPAQAVAGAVAAQQKVEHHEWPDGVRLRVRMGLHFGQVTVSGGTYVGLTVHEASRIANAAHGGQILCSGAAAIRLGDALPMAVKVRDLGSYVLRGFPEGRHLYQVCADGLQEDFPLPRGCVREGGTIMSMWFRGDPATSVQSPDNLPVRPLFPGVEAEIERATFDQDHAFRLVVRKDGVVEEEYDGLTVGGVTDAATIVNAHSRLVRID